METTRAESYKNIISTSDKEVELNRLGADGLVCSKGDAIKGLYRNCYNRVYGAIEDNVYFITDEQLEKFSIITV